MLLPALSGFFLGASLIIAIGAQNAYILRMGLLRQHVFALCLFCAASDAVLIIIGVAGLGTIVSANPLLLRIIAATGGLFLSAYAVLALKRAMNPQSMAVEQGVAQPLSKALATCFAFTWLNPHVYLDTVVLVGAYSARYADAARIAFGTGAVIASFAWFFALGYGARLLIPVFKRARTWQLLDIAIALIMASLAVSLFWTAATQ